MSDPLDWNAKTIAEFRANDGRVGGNFAGAPDGPRASANSPGGEDDGELLAYLAVVGVEGNVPGVCVDGDEAGDRALSEVDRAAGERQGRGRWPSVRGGSRSSRSSAGSLVHSLKRGAAEPGLQLGECIAFAQVGDPGRACCPGSSFRHRDPIDLRWRRMIPAT
jgi:hypothetical protein